MKIEIEVSEETITNGICDPHSRYWCSAMEWDHDTQSGSVSEPSDEVDEEGEPLDDIVTEFDEEDIKLAFSTMLSHDSDVACVAARIIDGSADGRDRDVFLQFVAFGALRY